MSLYSYPAVEPRFNLKLVEPTRSWLHYTVDFPVAKPTRYEENNTARGEFYSPETDSAAPLVILVHGWGDQSAIPCRLLARALVKRGIACFMLYLVFHSSRMPASVKEKGINLTPEERREGYQTSVIDVRQVVDWWAARRGPEPPVAVVGVSLGGFIGAISMGLDRRIGAGVFVVTGGNYENPAWAKKNPDPAAVREAQARYAQYRAEVLEKGFEEVTPLRESYVTDPMTFAGFLRGRPVMMINARWDERIPKQAALDFWEACGRPTIKWLPTTHTSLWALYPLVQQRVVHFLTSIFRPL